MIRWYIEGGDGSAELRDGPDVLADVRPRSTARGWVWRVFDGEARRAPTRKAGIAAVEARIIEIAEAIKDGAR